MGFLAGKGWVAVRQSLGARSELTQTTDGHWLLRQPAAGVPALEEVCWASFEVRLRQVGLVRSWVTPWQTAVVLLPLGVW